VSGPFDLSGAVAVITGAGGVLCGGIARDLAAKGVAVAVLDKAKDAAERVAQDIIGRGGKAVAIQCDVLDRASLEDARQRCEDALGPTDFLINGAGGNHPEATTGPDKAVFDLPPEAFRFVVDLNLLGTVLPCQVFGRGFADRGQGVILNISSMNAFRPLTKIPAYSAGKAAMTNFTRWLAVHMAQEYSPRIRVDAIAPGFFLTNQNRYLLIDEKTGELTPRGKTIIDHTPMGRFGTAEDLFGVVTWLLSPAAAFVTGVVIPIDGGFSAFSGV